MTVRGPVSWSWADKKHLLVGSRRMGRAEWAAGLAGSAPLRYVSVFDSHMFDFVGSHDAIDSLRGGWRLLESD